MGPYTVLVGGWEFTREDGVDKKIAEMSNGRVLLIPDASNHPDKQIERATETYRKYNAEIVLLNENDEKTPDDINVVYLGGGDPERLVEYFKRRSKLFEYIKGKYLSEEIILCGSSTGAMVQFEKMLDVDSRGNGKTNLIHGFGFIKNDAVVVPHWGAPRYCSEEWEQRFLQDHKDKTVITIAEYTGLFWRGTEAEIVGLGEVNISIGGRVNTYKNGDKISDFPLLT